MALVYLSFLFVRHTSSSNIPGLAEIARIDSPYINRMTKSIQKSVGRYDFGGIKWQYGFSMDGADAGVRFRSPPQVRRCCCLHPQITGHTPPLPFRSEMSSSAFSFPSELLSSFPAASDDVMTGECRILRFWHVECHSQKWKLCMDRMSDQNLWWHENQNYWMVTVSREKRLVLIKSLTLCVLNALVGPQLTIYIYKYIFQGPKANSSRNQNINLWQEVFQEMIESTYHAESGLTAAPGAAGSFADENSAKQTCHPPMASWPPFFRCSYMLG